MTNTSAHSCVAIVAHVREVLDSVPLRITHAIVFESVARNEHTPTSDVDVLVVSPDFAGVTDVRPGRPLRDTWDYSQYGSVDFIAYTPAEYDAARDRTGGLIPTAEAEGIHVVDPALGAMWHAASDRPECPNW